MGDDDIDPQCSDKLLSQSQLTQMQAMYQLIINAAIQSRFHFLYYATAHLRT